MRIDTSNPIKPAAYEHLGADPANRQHRPLWPRNFGGGNGCEKENQQGGCREEPVHNRRPGRRIHE
jgi:hypothetical protein